MSESIIAMRSQTIAVKAVKLLSRHGIRCRLVSVDPSLTSHGCSFGVAIDSHEVIKAEKLLDMGKINYGEVLGPRVQ